MIHILSAINVVLPIFIIIFLGYFLKTKKIITDDFVSIIMKLVFNLSLPSLLFLKVSQSDLSLMLSQSNLKLIGYCFIVIIVIYTLSRIVSKIMFKEINGAFVQGSFRSNYILIGGAILLSMFGDGATEGLAVTMIIVIPMFNILSIWVLKDKHDNMHAAIKKIMTNPLILAILVGLIAAGFKFEAPNFLNSTLRMLGNLGTPLGLIGIGSYLNIKDLAVSKPSYIAVFLKLVLFPTIALIGAYLLGFDYLKMTTIYMLFGSPTAISSFIMAKTMNNHPKLAANIVIMSTAVSMMTYIVGLSIINYLFQ